MGFDINTTIQNSITQASNQASNQISNSVENLKNRVASQIPLSPEAIGNRVSSIIGGYSNAIQSEINSLAVYNYQDPFPKPQFVSFDLLNDKNVEMPNYSFHMRINPSTWDVQFPPKSVQEIKTLGGVQLQYWYPELGHISAAGTIGNMLTAKNESSFLASNAWLYLQKLLKVYLNNGVSNFRNTTIATIGQVPFNPTVRIIYNGYTYMGYLQSFNLQENEENPYSRNYTFDFKFFDFEYVDNISEASQDIGLINAANSAYNTFVKAIPGGFPINPTSLPKLF